MSANQNFVHPLGVKAKDVVTGFAGIICGRVQYLTGCNQYLIRPAVTKDGNMSGAHWIDENRIKTTSKKSVVLPNYTDDPGPDMAAPVR